MITDIDLNTLVEIIRSKGIPTHVNILTRAAVQAKLETEAKRVYATGARYDKDETIWLDDQLVTVIEARQGGNPKQGKFTVLTLKMTDGKLAYMAAEAPGASAVDRKAITDEEVRLETVKHGPEIRKKIQEAMISDDRFVWFQDEQGDQWCLRELLPEVGNQEIAQAWQILRGLVVEGVIYPKSTETIVKELWEQNNDGSQDYLLKAFAINAALQQLKETCWLGSGWVLEEEWQEVQARLELLGPREPNIIEIPEGVTIEKEEGNEGEKDTRGVEKEEVFEEDFVTWEQKRLRNSTITLSARNFYENWLPLNRDLQRIFPPRASGADMVILHHRFGGDDEAFPAWVDWNQKRVLGSPSMYQAFYQNGIYPGAKLIISHRGNYQDYDIRTKPPTKQDKIHLRRISLAIDETGQIVRDEEGHPRIEYEEYDEPRRYEVTDEVFIVGASWEDREALFAEADRVGQGFFGLMYKVCCEWWEAKGREPLYVTAEELFQEIHFHRRPVTSAATIPLELWWRSAFEPVGGRRYRFRPEKGDQLQFGSGRGYSPKKVVIPTGPKVKKDRSILEIVKKREGVKAKEGFVKEGGSLWVELEKDTDRLSALEAAIQIYMQDPIREKILFLRAKAHQQIRELLKRERIEHLTLDKFNQEIWQLGRVWFKGHYYPMISDQLNYWLGRTSLQELSEAYQSGELIIEGNQTWGSFTSVIGPQLRIADKDMELVVISTLKFLLYNERPSDNQVNTVHDSSARLTLLNYSPGNPIGRMQEVIFWGNGFGMNIVSGIMHAVFPDEHILYNEKSKQALEKMGFRWPDYRLSRVDYYEIYLDFCKILLERYGFVNLTDVDWFIYNLSVGLTSFDVPEAKAIPSVEIPDIGIRHIVYPIPFLPGRLSERLPGEESWSKTFEEAQLSLWPQSAKQLNLWQRNWSRRELDEALMRLIADRDANRFVTHREVVDFMVNLAQPKPGERVIDICCGTGIFLVKAQRFVKEVYGEDADLELCGADIYGRAVEAAKLNLLANGARNFTLVEADSLSEPESILRQRYDLILGNPPFGSGLIQSFLRVWEKLLENGARMVVNISPGALANAGHKDLRYWLVSNFDIELIAELPKPDDYSMFGAKSSILYARKVISKNGHVSIIAIINNLPEMLEALKILRGE